MSILQVHLRSQKARLIESVRVLSEELARPVCSQDLQIYFARRPELRPDLLKRLGQQLLAAARNSVLSVPRVHQIGLIGNRAFYAASPDPRWERQLDDYRQELALRTLEDSRIADYLLSHPDDTLCVEATIGLAAEVAHILSRHSQPDQARLQFLGLIDDLRPFNERLFRPRIVHPDLSRREASDRLTRLVAARRDGRKLSTNRYLARLRWPQTSLFETPAGPRLYWSRQIDLYVDAKWPDDFGDEILATARFWASRYGCAE